ncbi:hypothetical protein [Pseudobacteriovorax antillogorgiicola]|uniref:Tetratricopeptide repeat-containing protein n=2 Tax=Pseudobacteriovorax antillogorgiicola TaxID=1513793 RepID=A0A1Y6BDU0_9BACT|nr:hypothetical protein [Pseudobacteriovorax antillogorgiicola]TCS56484.1 hypothetical protein EDD56_104306 [Pseudobacteriovorax antillogorgiicola]SMF04917.1 hypothetical protein SAMN06296036_10427 [Pseudobacteriovorax antillogorgiicola]
MICLKSGKISRINQEWAYRMKSLFAAFFSLYCSALVSCASLKQDPLPKGVLKPQNQELADKLELLENGASHVSLDHSDSQGLNKYWYRYAEGMQLMNLGLESDADASWQALIEELNTPPSQPKTAAEFRLLAKALRKVGALKRKQKDYWQALGYHTMALNYLLEHGSPAEAHQALISMEIDMHYLSHPLAAINLLKKSVQFAKLIDDQKLRAEALGITFNNLASTYQDLGRFADAESAILQSWVAWKRLAALIPAKSDRLVRAYLGVSDVYFNWARELKARQSSYQEQVALGLDAVAKGKSLSKLQGPGENIDASFETIEKGLLAL